MSLKTCTFEYDYHEDTYVFVKRESSPIPFDFDNPDFYLQIDDVEGYSNVISSDKLDRFGLMEFSQNGSFFLYGSYSLWETYNRCYWSATVGANGEEDFSYVFVDIDFDTGASEYNLVLATEDSRLLVEKHDSYHLTKSIVGKKGDKLEIDVSLGMPPGVDRDAKIYTGGAFFWNEYVYVETVDYSVSSPNRPKKLYRSPATGGGFDLVCEYAARFEQDYNVPGKKRGPWRAIFEQIEGSYNYNYGVLNVETGAIKMFHHGTFGYRKDSFQCDGRYAYHLRENYWDGDFDKERGIVYIHDLSLQYDVSEYSTSAIDLALPPWDVGSIVSAFDDNEVGLFFRVGGSEALPFIYHATSSTHKMYFTGFTYPDAIGWPAGGVKPIPRFWTSLVGCTEKP